MGNLEQNEGWKEVVTRTNDLVSCMEEIFFSKSKNYNPVACKQNKKIDKELLVQVIKYDEERMYLYKQLGDDVREKLGCDDVDDLDIEYHNFIYKNS